MKTSFHLPCTLKVKQRDDVYDVNDDGDDDVDDDDDDDVCKTTFDL